MASTLSKLFAPTCGWDLDSLPDPYKNYSKRCKDPDGMYRLNTKSYSTLHADVTKAVFMYTGMKGVHNGVNYDDFGVVKVSDSTFAAERKVAGTTEIAVYNINNGSLQASSVLVATTTPRYRTFGALTKNSDTDITTICLALLPAVALMDTRCNSILESVFSSLTNTDLYYISDAVYQLVNYDNSFPVNIPQDGNIDLLSKKTVSSGAYNGTALRGRIYVLAGNSSQVKSTKRGVTMAEAKTEFAAFANNRKWSPDEEMFIPNFPDDFVIPDESLKIARRFVMSSTSVRPMRNFMWRGVTSYGKSTGVEAIACMLHTPLLRMTCSTNMETQNFLADFVPDTATGSGASELPDFETISFAPDVAYKELTGISDPNATEDMCLKAYGEKYAKLNSSAPRYKFVESNYVKALTRGYIVEIQECSRIKDPGVLVGLNEYDRPGAVIPLIDGTYKRRDNDAMVIYTDNIGYSCRPMDPSVIRRMAFVINSYELSKDKLIARVKYNTNAKDGLINSCYSVWSDIKEYCEEHDITEGEISATELEACVQSIIYDGDESARDNIIECIISKLTTDKEEYDSLVSMIDTNWGKYNF